MTSDARLERILECLALVQKGKTLTKVQQKQIDAYLDERLGAQDFQKIKSMTSVEVSEFLGCSPDQVKRMINEQGFPTIGAGRINLQHFCAYLYSEWLKIKSTSGNRSQTSSDEDDDLSYKEELDKFRALKEGIHYEKMKGLVLDRNHLKSAWLAASAQIRQAGETLQKNFGSEAKIILDEAIDEADTAAQKALDQIEEALEDEANMIEETRTAPSKKTSKRKVPKLKDPEKLPAKEKKLPPLPKPKIQTQITQIKGTE